MDNLAWKILKRRPWLAALVMAAAVVLLLAAGIGTSVFAETNGAGSGSDVSASSEPVPSLVTSTQCLVDRYNEMESAKLKSLNCTSNDVRLAEYTLVNGPTTCVLGDNIKVTLKGEFVATASTRWDVGAFVGANGDNPNAAGTTCYQAFLAHASTDNTDMDLHGGSGPFYNGELTGGAQDVDDTCGDIQQGQNAFLTMVDVSIKCQDSDNNGEADLPTCTVWNNSGDTSPSCTSTLQTSAETSSKCNCGSVPISGLSVRPGLTTSASGPVTVGQTIKDTATLSGGNSPTGTISFQVYAPGDTTCSTPLTPAPTSATVNGDGSYSSGAFTTTMAGDYRWRAFYSGDSKNVAVSTACNDANESSTVNKVSPTIATTLSATTASIGDKVHDSAALTGATSDAGGTVTYSFFTDNACTQNKVDVGIAKAVTNGVVADSDDYTFNTSGTYYWQAAYSGDSKNNSAKSDCTKEVLVVKTNPSISTAQNLKPNDSATITGATSTAGGKITFSLFSPSDTTCSGMPAYTADVNVSGNNTYSTNNTDFIASTVGTWRWKVTYSGDANNNGTTSACGVENFTIVNTAAP